jgi:hypothetical protein
MNLDVEKDSQTVSGELALFAAASTTFQPPVDGGCTATGWVDLVDFSGVVREMSLSSLGPVTDPEAWAFYPDNGFNVLDTWTLDGFSPGDPYVLEVLTEGEYWEGTFDFPTDFVLASPITTRFDPTADLVVAWDDPVPGAVIEVELAWADTDERTYCSYADVGSITLDAAMLAVGDPGTVNVFVRRRELRDFAIDGVGTGVASISIEVETLQAQ